MLSVVKFAGCVAARLQQRAVVSFVAAVLPCEGARVAAIGCHSTNVYPKPRGVLRGVQPSLVACWLAPNSRAGLPGGVVLRGGLHDDPRRDRAGFLIRRLCWAPTPPPSCSPAAAPARDLGVAKRV